MVPMLVVTRTILPVCTAARFPRSSRATGFSRPTLKERRSSLRRMMLFTSSLAVQCPLERMLGNDDVDDIDVDDDAKDVA